MKTRILAYVLLILVSGATHAFAKVRVVASTSDLASITKLVGGSNVSVDRIASGKMDPHYIEILPSYMVKISRARLYLKVGMELDYWANQLIDGSGNGNLLIVDCSQNIERLEVPTMKVSSSMGDVHTLGNPHYWLSPDNALVVATNITEALKQVDPKNSSAYDAGLAAFTNRLEAKVTEWNTAAEPLHGMQIVTYHNSWPYLAKFLGIKVAGFVEPKPGIEPTPSHTAELIELIRANNIKVIGKEPYFSDRTPKAIAQETGAVVVDLPPSVGGADGADDYFSLMDTIITTLSSAQGGR